MYEVNAEKKPDSFCFAALSMTWLGLCKGMGGSDTLEGSLEKNGGIKELTKRLSHIRMIWGAC